MTKTTGYGTPPAPRPAGKPGRMLVPVYEHIDENSPGTRRRDLEAALKLEPEWIETDRAAADAWPAETRVHFHAPAVPDPSTLDDRPEPPDLWSEILDAAGLGTAGNREEAIESALTHGTCGWPRPPGAAELRRAAAGSGAERRDRTVLKEWTDTADSLLIAAGWKNQHYTPASLAEAMIRLRLRRSPAAVHLQSPLFKRREAGR